MQGIGWALNEEYIHDADGVMENPGFLDYRIPVASDLPMIETIIVEVPNPNHPYGVRGVGEVGIVPPLPALANAVYDATGARIRELPMSPPRVLEGDHVRQRRRGLMAQVHFSSNQRRLTGGAAQVEVEAATVRELLRKLEEMFPGIRAHLDQTSATAVAIDGDIIPRPDVRGGSPRRRGALHHPARRRLVEQRNVPRCLAPVEAHDPAVGDDGGDEFGGRDVECGVEGASAPRGRSACRERSRPRRAPRSSISIASPDRVSMSTLDSGATTTKGTAA